MGGSVGSFVSSIFGGAKTPDTSAQSSVIAQQEAEERAKLEKRKQASLRARSGKRSLLYGDEQGVKAKTLGGGQ